jgi:hypothetical protein
MDIDEQTDSFLFDLQNVVHRYRQEYDLNHATIVGVIEMLKLDYMTDDSIYFDADFLDDEIGKD